MHCGLTPARIPGAGAAPGRRTGGVHKGTHAADWLKERGAWFLFLPRCSPDLGPIEMAIAKLKARVCAAAARTFGALWRAIGNICDRSSPIEGRNDLEDTGSTSD